MTLRIFTFLDYSSGGSIHSASTFIKIPDACVSVGFLFLCPLFSVLRGWPMCFLSGICFLIWLWSILRANRVQLYPIPAKIQVHCLGVMKGCRKFLVQEVQNKFMYVLFKSGFLFFSFFTATFFFNLCTHTNKGSSLNLNFSGSKSREELCRLLSGPLIQFHWFTCLFFCQYQVVFTTVVL